MRGMCSPFTQSAQAAAFTPAQPSACPGPRALRANPECFPRGPVGDQSTNMRLVDPGAERKPTDGPGGKLMPKFQTKSSGYFSR